MEKLKTYVKVICIQFHLSFSVLSV